MNINANKFGIISAVLLILLFYSNAAGYLYAQNIIPVKPALLLLVVFILALPAIIKEAHLGLIYNYLKKPAIFIAFITAVSLASLLIHFDAGNQKLFLEQIVEMIFLVVCCLILYGKTEKPIIKYSFAVCLIIAIILNLFEIIHPGVFSNTGGRSAGFYVNPNISALAIILGWIIAFDVIPEKYRSSFSIIIGAAIFSTLSRMGVLLYFITLGYHWFRREKYHSLKPYALNVSLLIFLVMFFSYGYYTDTYFRFCVNSQTFGALRNFIKIDQYPQSKPAIQILASVFSRAGNLTPTGSNKSSAQLDKDIQKTVAENYGDDSLSSRAWLTVNSFNVIKNNPLLGVGMRKAQALQPHNEYLLLAMAYGIWGWIVYPSFCALIALKGEREMGILIALVLLIAGIASHNLLVDRTVLLPAAFAFMLKDEEREKKII